VHGSNQWQAKIYPDGDLALANSANFYPEHNPGILCSRHNFYPDRLWHSQKFPKFLSRLWISNFGEYTGVLLVGLYDRITGYGNSNTKQMQ